MMSALASANTSRRNLLSKPETRVDENASVGEFSLTLPLCSYIFTLKSDSSSLSQILPPTVSSFHHELKDCPEYCIRLLQPCFISVSLMNLSLCSLYIGSPMSPSTPAEGPQVHAETAVPAHGISPARGCSLSWLV